MKGQRYQSCRKLQEKFKFDLKEEEVELEKKYVWKLDKDQLVIKIINTQIGYRT